MSPQSLTDETRNDVLDDIGTQPGDPAVAIENRPDPTTATNGQIEASRTRLTVRQIQIALDAARSLAGGGTPVVDAGPAHASISSQPDPADGRRAHDDVILLRTQPEAWLPEHDGPVSLTAATVPRTRAVRRAAATPDKTARRTAKPRTARRTTAAIAPAVAAAATVAPPRLVMVSACGGAGASTATVLLAAALAPVTGALLVASGADRGSLSVRANASGGDIDAVVVWAARHPGRPLQSTTSGMARGNAGTGQLMIAAASRDNTGRPFDADTAAALLSAAASTRAAVLLDWSYLGPLPGRIWTSATHVLVVAPAAAPGLLDAEYVAQNLRAAVPAGTLLSVLTVDVRGRARHGPSRAGRAALARLQALDLPVTALPYDPALADDPRVHWPALRSRTRSAVFAILTHLLHPDLVLRSTPKG